MGVFERNEGKWVMCVFERIVSDIVRECSEILWGEAGQQTFWMPKLFRPPPSLSEKLSPYQGEKLFVNLGF